jgi:hypothetical protein
MAPRRARRARRLSIIRREKEEEGPDQILVRHVKRRGLFPKRKGNAVWKRRAEPLPTTTSQNSVEGRRWRGQTC